jgi:GT2 family glycosyltransferase
MHLDLQGDFHELEPVALYLASAIGVRYYSNMTGHKRLLTSLIVPTYRREEALVACLQSAIMQDYSPLEILVIDQTESHLTDTDTYLRNIESRVRIIRHSPPSAVTARNAGLKAARGDILIFIDDDTTFDPTFVSAHVAAHSQGTDVVQGRVVEHGRGIGKRPQWMRPWLRVIGSNSCNKPGVTNTLTGCNFSLSRRVFEKIGEFDTKFSGLLLREDADYGARCHKAGFTMRFDASASVIHHREESGGVDFGTREASRLYEPSVLRNELYFARKHFPALVVWLYKRRLLRRLTTEHSRIGIAPKKPFTTLIHEADTAAMALLKS